MELLFNRMYIAIDKSYETDPRGITSAKKGGKFENLINLLRKYSVEKENTNIMLAEWVSMDASYVEDNMDEFNFINAHIYKGDLLEECYCLCGTRLNYLFPIKNKYAEHNYIAFIGSSCINHFGEEMVRNFTKTVKKVLNLYNCEECNSLIRKRFDWHDKVRKHKKCLDDSEYERVFLVKKYPDVCDKKESKQKKSVRGYAGYDSDPDCLDYSDPDLNDSYIQIRPTKKIIESPKASKVPKVPIFTFGKCKGIKADEVLKNDMGYCKWFARTITPEDIATKHLCEYLKKN